MAISLAYLLNRVAKVAVFLPGTIFKICRKYFIVPGCSLCIQHNFSKFCRWWSDVYYIQSCCHEVGLVMAWKSVGKFIRDLMTFSWGGSAWESITKPMFK